MMEAPYGALYTTNPRILSGVWELIGVLCSILVIRHSNCIANHDDAALVAAAPLQVVALTDCCWRHCMAQRVPGRLMKTAADFAAGVAG